jgi:DUF4097 and DUF4098 domain-containing protein YvlB
MKMLRLLFISSLLFATAAMADVKETEEFSFSIESGGRLSLENINGGITIVGGSGDQIEVIAYKKAGAQEYMDDLEIVIDEEPDYIRIETRHPKSKNKWLNWGNDHNGSVSYELTVPSNINLDTISTVNGSVDISNVAGVVKAETVNGDLEVSGLTSDVNLETVNGGISAEFETLGGDQRVSAEAVNGKITLRIPADASARINAETVNGSIDADDFGLKPEKGFVGRDLNGEIGDGDARISADTVNGSIRIYKR